MKYLIVIILAMLSGILYRMGGSGNYDTKARDIGCPALSLVAMYLVGVPLSWWYFLTFMLSFAAMTTYHKWTNKILGKTDNSVYWLGWLVTGIVYAICAFPATMTQGLFIGPLIRVGVLGLLICLWSEFNGDAVVEEFGRGFFFILTIPIITT